MQESEINNIGAKRPGLSEIIGAAFIILGLLVFFSTVSHNPDPMGSGGTNMVGAFGKVTAMVLIQTLGNIAYLVGPMLIVMGISGVYRGSMEAPLPRIGSLGLVLLSLSVLTALFDDTPPHEVQAAGGFLGRSGKMVFSYVFGGFGTGVLMVGLLGVSTLLALRLPLPVLMENGREFFLKLLIWSRLPVILRQLVQGAMVGTGSGEGSRVKTGPSPAWQSLKSMMRQPVAPSRTNPIQNVQTNTNTATRTDNNSRAEDPSMMSFFSKEKPEGWKPWFSRVEMEGEDSATARQSNPEQAVMESVPPVETREPEKVPVGASSYRNEAEKGRDLPRSLDGESEFSRSAGLIQDRADSILTSRHTPERSENPFFKMSYGGTIERPEAKEVEPSTYFHGKFSSDGSRFHFRHGSFRRRDLSQEVSSNYLKEIDLSILDRPGKENTRTVSTPIAPAPEETYEVDLTLPDESPFPETVFSMEDRRRGLPGTPVTKPVPDQVHEEESVYQEDSPEFVDTDLEWEEGMSDPLEGDEMDQDELSGNPEIMDPEEEFVDELDSFHAGPVEARSTPSVPFVEEMDSEDEDDDYNDKNSGDYMLPQVRRKMRKYRMNKDFLHIAERNIHAGLDEEIDLTRQRLEKVLTDFGVQAKVVDIRRGPIITQFEIKLEPGTRVNRVLGISDEIKMNLETPSLRIVAPIPGKSTIGIEVPNTHRDPVSMGEIARLDPEFQSANKDLGVILGKDIQGENTYVDLARLPHLLIAGATGAGKSVYLNAAISHLLLTKSPEDVRFIMVDPKMVELKLYEGIPHLLMPVITDVKKASRALGWAVSEMEYRYSVLSRSRCRDIRSYNERIQNGGPPLEGEGMPGKMPYIILIIDELSDLMMVSAKDVEDSIIRLTQKARAVGIHVIMATQRPSVDVITALIKANCPSRISFHVAQKTDSRTILDANGAESLLGRGDMLFKSPSGTGLKRIQAPLVTEDEIETIVSEARRYGNPSYVDLPGEDDAGSGSGSGGAEDAGLVEEAWAIIQETGKTSTSYIQRRLRIGYNRAANLIELLEEKGFLGPAIGNRPREILKRS